MPTSFLLGNNIFKTGNLLTLSNAIFPNNNSFQANSTVKGLFINVKYQLNCSENYMKIDVEHNATENDFIFNMTAVHMVPFAEMKVN